MFSIFVQEKREEKKQNNSLHNISAQLIESLFVCVAFNETHKRYTNSIELHLAAAATLAFNWIRKSSIFQITITKLMCGTNFYV